jgi:hypothetical protein
MSTGGSGRIGAGPEANEGANAGANEGTDGQLAASMPTASSAPMQQLLHPPWS